MALKAVLLEASGGAGRGSAYQYIAQNDQI